MSDVCEICDKALVLFENDFSAKIYRCPNNENTHFYIIYRNEKPYKKVYLFEFLEGKDIITYPIINLTVTSKSYKLTFPSIDGRYAEYKYSIKQWEEYMGKDFDPKNPYKIFEKFKMLLVFS